MGPRHERYVIAINRIGRSQSRKHYGAGLLYMYICDLMNRTRWLYKYYCIYFEIRRKVIFNAFLQFDHISKIQMEGWEQAICDLR